MAESGGSRPIDTFEPDAITALVVRIPPWMRRRTSISQAASLSLLTRLRELAQGGLLPADCPPDNLCGGPAREAEE